VLLPVWYPKRISDIRLFRRSASTTASHEFSPVCAVLGGLLAQDVLKALGRREAPLDNFFVFDGVTGAGSTLCMRNAAK